MSETTNGVSQVEAGEWLPIDSAPRDGTPLLVFCPTHYQGKGGQAVAVWMPFSDRPGWYGGAADLYDPTHWRPLPKPPEPLTR